MKVTIKKGIATDKELGSSGVHDKIFIDGRPLRDVTDYKIERSATDLGFNVTIKMKADVEIIGLKYLSDAEKAKMVKEFQEIMERVFG